MCNNNHNKHRALTQNNFYIALSLGAKFGCKMFWFPKASIWNVAPNRNSRIDILWASNKATANVDTVNLLTFGYELGKLEYFKNYTTHFV